MALSATLLLTLVSVSCSQRRRTPEEPKPDLGVVTPPKPIDPPVPQPKPEPKPKPRFEGWTTRPVLAEQQPHLVLLTERARGEKIRFWVDAPQDKRKDVWVDLNNNARKDKGEEIDLRSDELPLFSPRNRVPRDHDLRRGVGARLLR